MKCYFCKEEITEAMRTFVKARNAREKDAFRDLCLNCYKAKMKAEGKVYRFILPVKER